MIAAIGMFGAYIAGASVIGFLPVGMPEIYRLSFISLAILVLFSMIYSIIRYKTIIAICEYIFFGGALVWKFLLIPLIFVIL